MKSSVSIIDTGDGSSSLFDPKTGDNYHSKHGAETESEHVFIKKGLLERSSLNPLRILEIGMGTGLNALLTYSKAFEINLKIEYVTLEPLPIDQSLAERLIYRALEEERNKAFFGFIHSCNWNQDHAYWEGFKFRKEMIRLQDFASEKPFDLIYYDAFGPTYQPEMWEIHTLEKLMPICAENTFLVSYCAQGQFRRNLEALGFQVRKTEGPPGKREMVQAIFGRGKG